MLYRHGKLDCVLKRYHLKLAVSICHPASDDWPHADDVPLYCAKSIFGIGGMKATYPTKPVVFVLAKMAEKSRNERISSVYP